MQNSHTFRTAWAAVACLAFAGMAVAQDYPAKPVRFVVADSPGSGPDLIGRAMSANMTKFLGQPIVVENMPGAGQMIGLEYVAKAPADGYTALIASVATFGLLPLTVKELRFDPARDLQPVSVISEGALVLTIASSAPWKTMAEFVAAAKANPGKMTYGSPNPIVRLASETLIRELGLRFLEVPYKGGAQYYQAIATREVDMGMNTVPVTITMGDKWRALAVSGNNRHAAFPDTPTFSEVGVKSIRGLAYALHVPGATPKAIVNKLYDASSKALALPETRATFATLKQDIVDQTPDASARRMAEDARVASEIAKAIGLKPQ